MVGKNGCELLDPLGEEGLYGKGNLRVEFMTFFEENALIRRFLDKGVLEDILQLRDFLFLPNELGGSEGVEVSVQFFDCFRHLLEKAVKKSPPDDRGAAEDLLHLLVKPVYAGRDDTLDRIRDGDGFDPRGYPPVTI